MLSTYVFLNALSGLFYPKVLPGFSPFLPFSLSFFALPFFPYFMQSLIHYSKMCIHYVPRTVLALRKTQINIKEFIRNLQQVVEFMNCLEIQFDEFFQSRIIHETNKSSNMVTQTQKLFSDRCFSSWQLKAAKTHTTIWFRLCMCVCTLLIVYLLRKLLVHRYAFVQLLQTISNNSTKQTH